MEEAPTAAICARNQPASGITPSSGVALPTVISLTWAGRGPASSARASQRSASEIAAIAPALWPTISTSSAGSSASSASIWRANRVQRWCVCSGRRAQSIMKVQARISQNTRWRSQANSVSAIVAMNPPAAADIDSAPLAPARSARPPAATAASSASTTPASTYHSGSIIIR